MYCANIHSWLRSFIFHVIWNCFLTCILCLMWQMHDLVAWIVLSNFFFYVYIFYDDDDFFSWILITPLFRNRDKYMGSFCVMLLYSFDDAWCIVCWLPFCPVAVKQSSYIYCRCDSTINLGQDTDLYQFFYLFRPFSSVWTFFRACKKLKCTSSFWLKKSRYGSNIFITHF